MLPNEFYERALSSSWGDINRELFAEALRIPPSFMLTDMNYRAADWNSADRLIRFSRSFIETHPWLTVLEVLKHEMAHQYVSDVLGIDDETAHGPAFLMVCDRYVIDGRASGIVRRSEEEEHTIDRIKKLLSLGASPNENEAKAALAKAQGLLDQYDLTEGDLRSSDPDESGAAHLGEVTLCGKPEDYRLIVSNILSGHFRVRTIWVGTMDSDGCRGFQLEVFGRRSDLAIAEHVHDFLHAEALRLWEQIDSSGGRRNKLDFLEGIMRGFLEGLDADKEARTAAGAVTAPGLVHVLRQLDDLFERRHPRMSRLRGSRRQRGEMYDQGVSAGRNIKMAKPIPGGGPKRLGTGGDS